MLRVYHIYYPINQPIAMATGYANKYRWEMGPI